VLGILYIINNVDDENIRSRASVRLIGAAVPFVVLFVAYLVHLLVKEGYAINAAGLVYMEPYKYLHNMIEMWGLLVLLLSGVIMVLFGIIYTIISKRFIAGIWQAGLGTIFTVLALLLLAGWNNTAYYPSTADLQSSLTLANSCSSEFTLRTMFYVSLLVPFVLAYIFYAWRAIDKKKITKEEIQGDDHAY
jgi:cytochrome d ubiquinol oxidase subunit II